MSDKGTLPDMSDKPKWASGDPIIWVKNRLAVWTQIFGFGGILAGGVWLHARAMSDIRATEKSIATAEIQVERNRVAIIALEVELNAAYKALDTKLGSAVDRLSEDGSEALQEFRSESRDSFAATTTLINSVIARMNTQGELLAGIKAQVEARP